MTNPKRNIVVEFEEADFDLVERAADAHAKAPEEYARDRLVRVARREADLGLATHIKVYRWARCDACGVLTHAMAGARDRSIPAPCCGAAPSTETLWPAGANLHLFAIERLDLDEAMDVHAATLFLSAACEAIVEQTLWHVYWRLGLPQSVRRVLDRGARTRDAQLTQYKGLIGEAPQAICDRAGAGSWFAAWSALAEARNELGHRDPGEKSMDHIALRTVVMTVHEGAIDGLALLHNEAMASVARQLAK